MADLFYMYGWLKKVNIRRLVLSSVAYMVISFIIHQIEAFITMKYYLMPNYFGVWSKSMMPSAGSPPLDFFVVSLLFSFTAGVAISLIYSFIRDQLAKDFISRSLVFADIVICMYFVFFTLPSYLLFNLPLVLIISWFISSFVIITLSSMVIVKILR